jgi:hypothetical protein
MAPSFACRTLKICTPSIPTYKMNGKSHVSIEKTKHLIIQNRLSSPLSASMWLVSLCAITLYCLVAVFWLFFFSISQDLLQWPLRKLGIQLICFNNPKGTLFLVLNQPHFPRVGKCFTIPINIVMLLFVIYQYIYHQHKIHYITASQSYNRRYEVLRSCASNSILSLSSNIVHSRNFRID